MKRFIFLFCISILSTLVLYACTTKDKKDGFKETTSVQTESVEPSSSGTASVMPITAEFADDALLSSGNYQEYIVDPSEYMVRIAFRAGENLSNVKFTSLQPNGEAVEEAEILYTLDRLSPETPFVLGVVFYGDMTTYGISFMDSTGTTRYYAIYVSGKDGSLMMYEYNAGEKN